MAGETVLVSGGSGFIGGWCIIALLNQGYTVRTTIRSLSREAEVRARLATEAPTDKLSFFAADLTSDAGWDEATAGCDYVLHVASPLGVDNPKDPNELIIPARDGALRAVKAAVKAGVKRVVLTSSVAATYPPHKTGDWKSDETVWTDPKEKGVGAYPQSKVIAEKAAWDYIAEHGGTTTTMSTVHPALVLGPVVTKENLGSVQVIQRLLNGSMPGAPRLGFNIVDVRDVADLHLRAMLAPEAAGQRFIAAGQYMWMIDLARVLRDKLGAKAAKAPTRNLPNFVLHLIALFDPALKSVSGSLGQKHEFSSAKAQSVLGWSPRPVETTIVECAESLIAHGAV